MRDINYWECCLELVYNEAIDDNGEKLGPCYNSAEIALRSKADKKLLLQNKGRDKLVWFDSEDPRN